jgi:hypothetical protein
MRIKFLETPTEENNRGNNIEISLKDVNYEDLKWIHLAQDGDKCQALGNTSVYLQVP